MAVAEAVGVPSDVITSSRHADPECGRPVEMAAVGLEKVDWYAGGTPAPNSAGSLGASPSCPGKARDMTTSKVPKVPVVLLCVW